MHNFLFYFLRKLYAFEDFIFEKKYSLELSGIVQKHNLDTKYKSSLNHAVSYQGVWLANLRLLLLEIKKCNYNFKNFIDIGSGKGKACFYVHINFSFRKIIGIEFSDSLFAIANKNKLKIDAKNVQFINTDASIFKLPNHPNLIFMFNPFDEIILEKFILNNLFHFKRYKSVIAYVNDKHRSILTKHGFKIIFLDTLRKISIYRLS